MLVSLPLLLGTDSTQLLRPAGSRLMGMDHRSQLRCFAMINPVALTFFEVPCTISAGVCLLDRQGISSNSF